MKIALGSDHAGYDYKEAVKNHLLAKGHEVLDCGSDSDQRCDYPDFCGPAAEAVAAGTADRCIVFGGSGNGEAIVANRVKGVRCALCWNEQTAIWARSHNDANGLSMGARTVSESEALHIVDIWLETEFEGGRHQPRIDKIDA
ncbi:MAG: ribose 5-phosphate isomerase B [Planctomycetes bacterium]|nr:ribose 5-phosphate isomerase B [Planctomycetota bacterium]